MQITPGGIQLTSDLRRDLVVILYFDQLPQSLLVLLSNFMLIPGQQLQTSDEFCQAVPHDTTATWQPEQHL